MDILPSNLALFCKPLNMPKAVKEPFTDIVEIVGIQKSPLQIKIKHHKGSFQKKLKEGIIRKQPMFHAHEERLGEN